MNQRISRLYPERQDWTLLVRAALQSCQYKPSDRLTLGSSCSCSTACQGCGQSSGSMPQYGRKFSRTRVKACTAGTSLKANTHRRAPGSSTTVTQSAASSPLASACQMLSQFWFQQMVQLQLGSAFSNAAMTPDSWIASKRVTTCNHSSHMVSTTGSTACTACTACTVAPACLRSRPPSAQ
jgi:hypothetical protein